MLANTLRFVRGSVAKKDLMPALTNFRIEAGRVQGYNGKIAISAPIDFDINCTPKATTLVAAIDRCNEEGVQFGMTKAGKLSVKSGKFRAYIDCIEGPTAHVTPVGDTVPINGEAFMSALATLQPLIGNDANKQWSNGILFDGQFAYATNNVIIGQYWLGFNVPFPVTLPREAVKELLRIGEPPVRVQSSENAFTAHYANGVWIWCQLIESKWPNMGAIIDKVQGHPIDVNPELFDALDNVRPFLDATGRVVLEPGVVRSMNASDECGAIYELPWIMNKGHFHVEMLLKLKTVAKQIDLSCYPNPCPWYGENVRGAIMGLRWMDEV